MPTPFQTIATAMAAMIISLPMTADAHPRHRHMVKVCRRSSGTTGLIAGGATGALVGRGVIGGPVGIVAGAVGGAFAGRAVDRSITSKRRCHYVERR